MAGMEAGSSGTSRGGADLLDSRSDRSTDVCTDAWNGKLLPCVCHRQPDELKSSGSADRDGTDEGEVISTIAVATSSIVTTAVIALGVALLVPLTPLLENPAIKPAFDNILPALFGGLAVVYVSKNWKIAIAPLVFMVVLFLLVPSLSGSVGVLVPVGALIAIGSARILYKKGKL